MYEGYSVVSSIGTKMGTFGEKKLGDITPICRVQISPNPLWKSGAKDWKSQHFPGKSQFANPEKSDESFCELSCTISRQRCFLEKRCIGLCIFYFCIHRLAYRPQAFSSASHILDSPTCHLLSSECLIYKTSFQLILKI